MRDLRLRGKNALITGAGSGIGRSSAILFAEEGARVAVVDLREDGGNETARMIKQVGGDAVFVQADVSEEKQIERMVEAGESTFGRIDILFNNAGDNLRKSATELASEEWDRLLTLNLKSVFLGCKHTLPLMMKAGGGSVINTASTFGLIGRPNMPAYCASKGGIIALTRQLALDYARYNIRVNCLCPGPTLTPRLQRQISSAENPELYRANLLASVPIGRLGKPEEIAHAALFLASDESSFVTGTALVVDGGQTAQ